VMMKHRPAAAQAASVPRAPRSASLRRAERPPEPRRPRRRPRAPRACGSHLRPRPRTCRQASGATARTRALRWQSPGVAGRSASARGIASTRRRDHRTADLDGAGARPAPSLLAGPAARWRAFKAVVPSVDEVVCRFVQRMSPLSSRSWSASAVVGRRALRLHSEPWTRAPARVA